ncbi:hypothetical protein JCM10213_004355 [Rhodosporidiobolus nylandii]
MASLVLPTPPPPPGVPVSRTPSSASGASAASSERTVRGPSASSCSPAKEDAEPTVDDLTRELIELEDLVALVSSSCSTILQLRDSIISSPVSAPVTLLEQLSGLTTSTGGEMLRLSQDLASTSRRLAVLQALTDAGTAASLPSEAAQLQERLSIVRSDASAGVKRVKALAAEEEDAAESARRRLEERVRRENAGMEEAQVLLTVDSAFAGGRGGMRVANLDVRSYAGRVALESPFTELAGLVEAQKEVDGGGDFSAGGDLSRTPSRFSTATGTTLVGSSGLSQYGKVELGPDEEEEGRTLLAGDSGARGLLLGDVEAARVSAAEGKMGAWTKLRRHWRDYLVRLFVLLGVAGLVVGILVYEALVQKSEQDDANSSFTATSAAAETGL